METTCGPSLAQTSCLGPWILHLRCEVMLAIWSLAWSRVLGQAVDNWWSDIPTGCRTLDSSGLDQPFLVSSRLIVDW